MELPVAEVAVVPAEEAAVVASGAESAEVVGVAEGLVESSVALRVPVSEAVADIAKDEEVVSVMPQTSSESNVKSMFLAWHSRCCRTRESEKGT